MQLDSLQRFFSASPAMHLLRSPHAPWILDFLNQQFKRSAKITQTHSELAAALELYLSQEELSDKRDKAETYLATWCSASTGWLKRFIDENQPEPSYQLTADTELVLSFVVQATSQPRFIGTRSRLRAILGMLDSVASGMSGDPQSRIEQLKRQRSELDRELLRLQSSSTGADVQPTEIREQFSLAAQQLEQLKSEFRAVEDRFKAIVRNVQQKVLTADESRGGILEFALDSEELLKQGDQGQSFFEFLKLLHSPVSQERIAQLVQQLTTIELLADQHQELDSIRGMVPALLAEAEKILRTTQHLSLTLRRLLDSRSTQHHQQLAHLLRDIRGAATRSAQQPPTHIGMEIEAELEIQSPLDRPFWSRIEPFEQVDLMPATVDAADQAQALQQLAALERIDWQTMRRNVTLMTREHGATSIAELLARFPVQTGTIELLGYIQIAHDDGHTIDRSESIEIETIWEPAHTRKLRLPNIVFRPEAERRKPAAANPIFASEIVL